MLISNRRKNGFYHDPSFGQSAAIPPQFSDRFLIEDEAESPGLIFL